MRGDEKGYAGSQFSRYVVLGPKLIRQQTYKTYRNLRKTGKRRTCNFPPGDVIKRLSGEKYQRANQGSGRWIGSQMYRNTRLLQNLSGSNTLEDT
jgi:hypothetical protein